jgi:hypothetical protein
MHQRLVYNVFCQRDQRRYVAYMPETDKRIVSYVSHATNHAADPDKKLVKSVV